MTKPNQKPFYGRDTSTQDVTLLQWSQLLARAWLADIQEPDNPNNFRNRLERDPVQALKYAKQQAKTDESYEIFASPRFDFDRIFIVEHPPSPIDGYTEEIIKQISKKGVSEDRKAYIMPSGYST